MRTKAPRSRAWTTTDVVATTLALSRGTGNRVWLTGYFLDRRLGARLLQRIAPRRRVTFAIGPDDATVDIECDVRLGGVSAVYEICAQRVYSAVARFKPAPGATVIDVGANIGVFTLYAASLMGAEGRVLAVEPHPGAFELLERNVADLPLSIALANVGCSDDAGQLRLAGDALHAVAASFAGDTQAGVPVPVLPLDVLTDIHLPAGEIALLKIDVEGWELPVLAGATATLARTRRIVIEVGEVNDAITGLLTAAGFELVHRYWSVWNAPSLAVLYFERVDADISRDDV